MMLPSCRLYLVAPVSDDMPAMIDKLTGIAKTGDVAALLFPGALTDKPGVKGLITAAQDLNIAAVLEADAARSIELGADGTEIAADPAAYAAARARIGMTGIVAARCGGSRHDAMLLGEAGADYVSLANDAELIGWWAEMFEVPCVAASPASLDEARPLIAAGADFIRPSLGIWENPDLARQYMRLIAEVAP